MSKLTLFDPEEQVSVWAVYEPGLKFKVRHLGEDVARSLREQATTVTTEYVRGRPFETKMVDEEKHERLLADHLIDDWDGVVNRDGSKVALTPENKQRVLKQAPPIKTFVSDVALNIHRYMQDEEARLTENLSDTSAGSKPGRRTMTANAAGPGDSLSPEPSPPPATDAKPEKPNSTRPTKSRLKS